eukprot:CCRYP_003685-RA/>CCRYP_003685-RA protein AED:0.24 eAED:0.24 QI:383/1/1/1/1/1/2/176/173
MNVADRSIRKRCSFSIDDRPAAIHGRLRKTVSFNSVPEVCQVHHSYPSDFFYTQRETDQFRREAQEEQKSSVSSFLERLSDVASSSVVLVVMFILGIVATTIACLPILLALKFFSMFIVDSPSAHDIDSSVISSPVEEESSIERMVCSLFGGVSTDCQEDYHERRYSPACGLK